MTINIKDSGDNQLDSAALIDNVEFWPELKPNISAIKNVDDINGDLVTPDDILEYTIYITNNGLAEQKDNDGNEFEDAIPNYTTYVTGSVSASSPVGNPDDPVFVPGENKITWNGEIAPDSTVVLTFQVTIDSDTPEGTNISNQGFAYWDNTDNGIDENNAIEYTDDPDIDDGIDQDGDGYTDDDDPTDITLFTPPDSVSESFSNDIPGGKATQLFGGYEWFETSEKSGEGNFEVASNYYYNTSKSFKTKLRLSSNPQYWNYSFSDLYCNVSWWESWFACGNASEAYDLYLTFKNENGENIAIIKMDYVQVGENPPFDWLSELSYFNDDDQEWTKLYSDNYLYNGWYKLRIEEDDQGNLVYYLNKSGVGQVASDTCGKLDAPLSSLSSIKWESMKDPIVCPMFFFDEHTIGLTKKN